MSKRNRSVLVFCVVFFMSIFASFFISALTDNAFPTTCSGGDSCSTTNYASNTTSVGHAIGKGATGSTDTWDDIAADVNATIDAVTLRFRHGGDAGINNAWTITFRNEAGTTTYCTDTSISHTSTDTYLELDATTLDGCTWNTTKLNDLEVTFKNNDASGPDDAFIYYAEIVVDYTDPSQGSCEYNGTGNFNINCSESCSVVDATDVLGNNVTFTNGTGTVTLQADIYNWTNARIEKSCTVRATPNGGLKW